MNIEMRGTLAARRFPMRFKTLFAPLLAAPLLAGCLLSSQDLPPLTVVSGGWLAGDSVLLFTVHDRPVDGRKQARLRVFTARVDSARSVHGSKVVFTADPAWACEGLRVSDTLVSLSYYPYPLPEYDRPQEGCLQGGPALLALRWQGDSLVARAEALDTAAYLAAIRTGPPGPNPDSSLFERRGSLNTYYKTCLKGGPCLEDVALEHDAKK
jgi:hypothetical protein